MSGIHKNNLPRPGAVDVSRAQARMVTPQLGGLVFTRRRDPALVVDQLTLYWDSARREVVDAISHHYRENHSHTFIIIHPRTAEEVHVRWSSPPSISWISPTTASVTGEVETALAHE